MKNWNTRGRQLGMLVLILCMGLGIASAQLDTGSLAGTVADKTGAVVPGAQLTATEQASGSVYKVTSSSSGSYVFTSLRPGTYNIVVTASGFQVGKVMALPVEVGTRSAYNFELSPGSTSETITVDASAPTLETESSDIGTVISQEQVENLPLASGAAMRSFSALTFLTPGSVGPGTNGGTLYTKIGGGQEFGSDNLVDGISTQRSENGTELFDQITPSVDAIEEFRVETLALPAYLGRTTGGIANFKTKGGTNQYHGTVYDFYRNTIFDANNYFNKGNAMLNGFTQDYQPGATYANPNPYRRPVDLHNDYGLTLGGPVWIPHVYNGKDKTFFFFAFENVPSRTGHSVASTVPTDAQRGLLNGSSGTIGDFSANLGSALLDQNGNPLLNPCTGNPILSGQIFDPTTTRTVNGVECRTPFTNNQVPIRSTLAAKLLALTPRANSTTAGTNNYVFNSTETVTQTDFSLRLDQNIGTRQHLYAFGNMRENFDSGVAYAPEPINPGTQLQDFYAKLLRVGYAYTITQNLVNEITFGANRINSINVSPVTLQKTNFDDQLGIPNTPQAGITFPIFTFGETNSLTLGSSNNDDNVDNALLLDDNVSWQKGPHSIRIGGTVRWQEFSYENNGPAAGTFNFARPQTAADNTGTAEAQTGNGYASFYLGAPSNMSRSYQVHAPRWIQNYYAAYAQDDWKVRKNLTLNLGVRYSIDTPRHEADGDISAFDPTIPNPLANGRLGALRFGGTGPGRDGNNREQLADTYYKDIEPRVGFAYQPSWLNDSMVVRGAYTIMYGPLIYADYGQGLTAGFTNYTPAANNDPYTPSGSLDAGPPTLSLTPNISSTYLTGSGVDFVHRSDGRPSEVQNFSLEIQQQIATDLIFTMGFLGERGTHLRSLVWWDNSLNPAYFGLGDTLTAEVGSAAANAAGVTAPFPNFFNVSNGAVGQALLPYPQYGYINNDSYLQNRGQSTYDALELKLQRKYHNGLNLLASYTWSKTITDADNIQPYFQVVLSQGGTQNPYNVRAEKVVSTQDVPQNFVVSYLYDLPFGRGKRFLGNSNRLVNALVGGFRIGGIDRYVSGQPISFWGAQGIPYFDGGVRFSKQQGQDFKTAAGKSGHYNVFGFKSETDHSQVNQTGVFNRAAFIDVNDTAHRGTGAFRLGDLPRNQADVRTPTYLNEDFTINKHFDIHDQISADLKLDAFDVFNRHTFAKPDSGVNDDNFGQINGLINGPRTMQIELKIHY